MVMTVLHDLAPNNEYEDITNDGYNHSNACDNNDNDDRNKAENKDDDETCDDETYNIKKHIGL